MNGSEKFKKSVDELVNKFINDNMSDCNTFQELRDKFIHDKEFQYGTALYEMVLRKILSLALAQKIER